MKGPNLSLFLSPGLLLFKKKNTKYTSSFTKNISFLQSTDSPEYGFSLLLPIWQHLVSFALPLQVHVSLVFQRLFSLVQPLFALCRIHGLALI